MTNKPEAISITESFIQNSEAYKGCVVDTENVLERETFWYIPFKKLNSDPSVLLVGAYNGLLVDKNSEDYLQPGSALQLEDWMYGFRIGLRGDRYDLLITKVNNQIKAVEILEKLKLSYVKIEEGTEWKIPQEFKRKEIQKRIEKLPCVFKNQSFTHCIKEFKKIRNERIFEYQLLKTENTDLKILGELIQHKK